MNQEELSYRPNVCMLVVNKQGQLFLGERYNREGSWQFPQGGVEDHSELSENVLRELEEELGAPQSCFSILAQLDFRHRYDFSAPPDYAKGKWRGQDQTFWVVAFLGNDEDITLVSDHPEFRAWQWCDADRVLTIAEPVRKKGYEEAMRHFLLGWPKWKDAFPNKALASK